MIKPLGPSFDDDVEEDESGLQPVHQVWDEVFDQVRQAMTSRDYARALDLGERFLKRNALHTAARDFISECRTIAEKRLTAALTPLDRVVVLTAPLHPLMSADIDHRSGFLLSRVDGHTSIEDLIDLAGTSRVDAMTAILDCLDRGFVAFKSRVSRV